MCFILSVFFKILEKNLIALAAVESSMGTYEALIGSFMFAAVWTYMRIYQLRDF